MKNSFLIIMSFLLLIIMTSYGEMEMETKADLVLMKGVITTMEDSLALAEAVAVKDGKIIAVGSNLEIENYINELTTIIDLEGNFVMPGFIESHAHFLGLGESLINLDLRNASNWNEVVSLVKEAVENSEPGEWIIGRGWHQEKFIPKPQPEVNGYPIHDELSKVSPKNPVMLSHASGHAVFANYKAMQIAGINNKTNNPAGGTIIKDKNGNPIGVFEENAESLIRDYYDEYLKKRTQEQIQSDYEKKIQLAGEECLKKGITSFHDAGETFEVIDVIKSAAEKQMLPVRLNVMVGDSYENMLNKLENYRLVGYADSFLTVRSIKQYIDGALGSRGAWLIEPYNDLPAHIGSNVTSLDDLMKIAKLAIEKNFQMRTHAIGDRGNREALNIYEKIFNEYPHKNNLRWSIEHAQHLSPQDIPRFAKLGVIAAMQPVHCTSDALFVPKRLGDERSEEGAYVWRKLIDSGAVICSGTDSPVEDVDPIKNIYSAVTRKLSDGTVFFENQKMSRLEVLKSYTINGAYCAFEEKIKGTITPGKLADFVVLSKNLLNCEEDDILDTKVLYTIINGKIVTNQNKQ